MSSRNDSRSVFRGDAERAADAVLRQAGPGREVTLVIRLLRMSETPLGGAGPPKKGAVVGQSRQLLCHARNSIADTRTKQHGY